MKDWRPSQWFEFFLGLALAIIIVNLGIWWVWAS